MTDIPTQANSKFTLIFIILIVSTIALIFVFNQKKKPINQDISLDETISMDSGQSKDSGKNTQQNNNVINNQQAEGTDKMLNKTQMTKPSMIIDQSKEYSANFDTNLGKFKIKLFADITPVTVNNFVYLAEAGFYDGLIFHRVIKDFMIQGGCPLGTGTGSPGYKFEDESNEMPLVKGSLAMANSGPNTNGSQFFIVTANSTPWLDGMHTNFGEVVEGLEIIEKIGLVQTGANDKPIQPVIINSVTISSN